MGSAPASEAIPKCFVTPASGEETRDNNSLPAPQEGGREGGESPTQPQGSHD